MRRRIYGNYKDQQSSWGFSTKGWEYGRKASTSLDIDSLSQRNGKSQQLPYTIKTQHSPS